MSQGMLTRRQLMLAALAAAAPGARAQVSGGGTSRIVVPFAAGGARELPARAILAEFGQESGQNWIIEARPGAGGAIGTVAVANAAPDGHTLLMAASSHFVVAAMGAKPFYDPIKGFAPVANIGNQSYVLIVNSALPIHSVADLVRAAKARPGQLNYNSAGIGSSTHLAMAAFTKAAGVSMQHIPFKGSAEALNDVAGGRGEAVIVPTAGVESYSHNPRLRLIAQTGTRRSPLLPQLPTIAEAGIAGFEFESWFGLLAPAGTPAAVVERLNAAVNRAVARPEVAERLRRNGIEAMAQNTVANFTRLFARDHEVMTRLVKESGISRD
jgi:tripartite-type tricarboxylate transporter receptor subunit TctC